MYILTSVIVILSFLLFLDSFLNNLNPIRYIDFNNNQIVLKKGNKMYNLPVSKIKNIEIKYFHNNLEIGNDKKARKLNISSEDYIDTIDIILSDLEEEKLRHFINLIISIR